MSKRIEYKIINGVECKHCSKCGEWKPLSKFSNCNNTWDGLQCKCNECIAKYYQAHKEERAAYNKQYYTEHAEEIAECQKKYRDTHKEELNQYDAERYATIDRYAYTIRQNNLREDRKYERCGKDEDLLPPLEYYIWALQQLDFYDGKQYHWSEMGLDRIYNDNAHTFANVVPCSTKNNVRRGMMPFEEFCKLMSKENEELTLACS